MRIVPVLLLAAACGGKSSSTSTAPEPAATGGAPWAAMFEQGHTWKLEVVTTDSSYDAEDPNADADGVVKQVSPKRAGSCTVAQVIDAADGKASKIECDWGKNADGEADSMAGNDPFTSWTWFANDTGLYVIAELPAAGATVAPGEMQMVLGATPAAFHHDLSAGDEEEGEGAEMMSLEQKGDTWCWTWGASMGDDMWQVVCFGADGVRSGEFGWAGGSDHSTAFTVVK